MGEPRWAYGVTTCARSVARDGSIQMEGSRLDTLLPRTLASLRATGFDYPRLFIDGMLDGEFPDSLRGHPFTCRYPNLRTYGNWMLGLAELYIRDPACHLYAMFQDDFVAVRNLRAYLNRCPYPSKGYWNLYTFPVNQELAGGKVGWFEAASMPGDPSRRQWGKGAVALVFSRQAVITLLTHKHVVERPMDSHRGWRAIDGGIVTAMNQAGWREHCHSPSLVQHTGVTSSMGNGPQQQAPWFPGEDFDAMEFLKEGGGPPPCQATVEWQMRDSANRLQTTFVLLPDGTARKSHAPAVGGKWAQAEDGVRIEWEDGWRDLLQHGKKLAFAPGSEFNGHPTNVQRAVRT